jgi:hypothetical protein
MKIDDLPSAFLLTDKLVQQLKLLPQQIVEHHVQVLNHEGCFYHLNPDLVFDVNEIVLCPIRAGDPMIKNEESIAVGNDYGLLAHLKPLNGTTRNECVPIRLYNINLQIREHHSTNHSCISNRWTSRVFENVTLCSPHVTFLGPRDAWHKVAHKYKHLFEMETKIAYDWLTFWVNAFIQVSKNALLIDPKVQRTK